MQCRDITPEQFETIAAELTNVTRQDGAIELVSGHHEDHGATVLIRDLTRCMALVNDPAFIDMAHTQNAALTAEGATVSRAMRAGRH